MNARHIALAALATSLLASGCAKKEETPTPAEEQAAAAPAVDIAAEEQAIRTRSGEWMNYANSKDAASIANNIYTADGVMISDDKAYKGAAAIQAKMEADNKKSPNALWSWTSDAVRVASSGDLAIETGSFNFDPDGDGKKPAVQGSFATTWAKADGEWRVLSDAGGANPEAPAP
jgi:uncharacterized protein (TIGR02246 family)